MSLRWQRGEVDEIWQTERFAYVADFQVGPVERGREPMLVVASVTNFDGLFTAPSSYLSLIPLRASFGR